MLECTIVVNCEKSICWEYDPTVSKSNKLEFRVRADTFEELKNYSKEITEAALNNLDHVIEKTEFDTKAELLAMKEIYG